MIIIALFSLRAKIKQNVFLPRAEPRGLTRVQIKCLTTGRMPQEHVPSSPLITLLEAIGPRDLQQIQNLTVDHRLGYHGQRTFQWASQALRWLKPDNAFSAPASQSYQDQRFAHKLYLEDLQECCSHFPEQLLTHHPRLCRPETPKKSPRP